MRFEYKEGKMAIIDATESYDRLADEASRLYEACLWAKWAAWDRHAEIPEVMERVLTVGYTVAHALFVHNIAPMRDVKHVRYVFNDGKFFCEGCMRNAEMPCTDECPIR